MFCCCFCFVVLMMMMMVECFIICTPNTNHRKLGLLSTSHQSGRINTIQDAVIIKCHRNIQSMAYAAWQLCGGHGG